VRVVADSHSLLYYLFTPDRLSEPAFEALGNAENSEGLVVSAATLGDLWYSSHKIGKRALTPGAFESLHATVVDPENEGFEVAAVDAATMARLMSFPLSVLPDPWDRMIVATALHLGVPLVTKDRAITAAGVVETIW
jgi:PIN domain nuclease of toxin-antitoxin system